MMAYYSLLEVKLAYEHFMKAEMPRTMTYIRAGQIVFNKVGQEKFEEFVSSI